MPRLLPFDNAIAWAHFRLGGGTRRAVIYFCVALALMGGGLLLTVAISLGSSAEGYEMSRGGTIAGEMVLMLLLAPGRSGSAVRGDLTGRLIESHRLMPISGAEDRPRLPHRAKPQHHGNLRGRRHHRPLCQRRRVATLDLLSTSVALVFSFGAMLCVVMTFAAFRHRVNAGVAVLVCVPFLLNRSAGLQMFPVASVLFGPFIGKTVFVASAAGGIEWPYAVSELFQAAVAGLFFVAAARLYRREGAVGFLPAMGLGLLTLFVAASLTGNCFAGEFTRDFFRSFDQQVPLTISVLIGMLLALLPVSAVARRRTRPPG